MTDQETAVSQDVAIDSPEKLVQARESRGMSKGEVAQRLKLAPRQLEAIERGDWSVLPGRAFIRGSIRSYGRLLNVDVEPLLETVGGLGPASEMLRTSSNLRAPMPQPGAFGFAGEGRGNLTTWLLLGVAIVVALALFFGRSGDLAEMKSWMGGAAPDTSSGAAPGAAAGSAPGTITSSLNGSPSLRSGGQPVAVGAVGADSGGAAPGVATVSSSLLLAPSSASAEPGLAAAARAADSPAVGSTGAATATARPTATEGVSPAGGVSVLSGPAPASAGATPAASAGATTPSVSVGATPATSAGATPAAPAVGALASAGATSLSGVGAASAVVGAGAPASSATAALASEGSGPVRLIPSEDAWVEVKQADGKVVHSGTLKAGAAASFGGIAPFSLVIGNATQVKVEYEGRPVALKPTPAGIARIKLP